VAGNDDEKNHPGKATLAGRGLTEVAMGRISRSEEAKLAAEFEQDADDDELWEEVPAPTEDSGRKTLGAQVTVRLDARSAEQLRQIARQRGVGYTSLVRTWVEERLDTEIAEAAVVRVSKPQITVAGASIFRNLFQLTGPARTVSAA
jgi:hypothetical protein